MTCALSIADQGHEAYLVEKDTELGGTARRLHYTLEGLDVQAYLHDIVRKVYEHPLIHVYPGAVITEATGYVGNFLTTVKSERGVTEIKHGAAVIAIGADEYKPTEYLYGEDDRVMTNLELEGRIATGEEGDDERSGQVRREWWRALALIALTLLLAEWLVYQRGTLVRLWRSVKRET